LVESNINRTNEKLISHVIQIHIVTRPRTVDEYHWILSEEQLIKANNYTYTDIKMYKNKIFLFILAFFLSVL